MLNLSLAGAASVEPGFRFPMANVAGTPPHALLRHSVARGPADDKQFRTPLRPGQLLQASERLEHLAALLGQNRTTTLSTAANRIHKRWGEHLIHGGDQFPDMGVTFT